ncbi:MAG TPA: hypothetical protein DIC60_04830 [Lachnospiraceae bacterium]|nr:hypothetical protein [Lachnospiraceae bacterium]
MEMDNIRRRRVWGLEIIEDLENNLRENLYELSLDDAYVDGLIKKYHSEDEYGGDKYNMMRLRIIAHQVNLKVLGKEKLVDIKEFLEAVIGFRHAIKEMNSKSE